MLDHYYTARDPVPAEALSLGVGEPVSVDATVPEKPLSLAPRTVVDLTSLSLEQIVFAFDCDSDSDSSDGADGDDGYVSTLLKLQQSIPLASTPRKIAGARRVARAASSPAVVKHESMEVETEQKDQAPEGELFQSITAIPGLETMSFEELRLETYMQSLIATGTARPHPAYTPATTIPPAFSPQFCDWDGEVAGRDVEMPMETPSASAGSSFAAHPPFVFRAASFPSANAHADGGMGWN